MSAIAKTKLTLEEYLEFERKSEEKHEYFGGEIFTMSGANRNHCLISANLGGLLWQHFKSKPGLFAETVFKQISDFAILNFPP